MLRIYFVTISSQVGEIRYKEKQQFWRDSLSIRIILPSDSLGLKNYLVLLIYQSNIFCCNNHFIAVTIPMWYFFRALHTFNKNKEIVETDKPINEVKTSIALFYFFISFNILLGIHHSLAPAFWRRMLHRIFLLQMHTDKFWITLRVRYITWKIARIYHLWIFYG